MGERARPAAQIIKLLLPSSVKSDDSGLYTWTLSTGEVDRDRDTIAPAGWLLDNFRKNPVLLWAHDSRQPPIGRVESITAENDALIARLRFPDAGVFPFADQIRGLVDGGFVQAGSVGFLPTKWTYDEKRGGFDYLEQELLEFSLVPVPANPAALAATMDNAVLVKAWAMDKTPPALAVTATTTTTTITPLPIPAPAEPPRATPSPAIVLRLQAPPRRLNITRAEAISATHNAVSRAVKAAVEFASGRLPN